MELTEKQRLTWILITFVKEVELEEDELRGILSELGCGSAYRYKVMSDITVRLRNHFEDAKELKEVTKERALIMRCSECELQDLIFEKNAQNWKCMRCGYQPDFLKEK